MLLDITNSLMVFYIIMTAGFFGNFFSCDLQRLFTNNIMSKHILAFISAFFVITLVDQNKKRSIPEMLKFTMIIYVIYILSTKAKALFVLPMLIILFIDQLIKTQLDILKEQQNSDKKEQFQSDPIWYENIPFLEEQRTYLSYIIIGLIVLGVTHYYVRARLEFGDEFDHAKFFLGTKQCANL